MKTNRDIKEVIDVTPKLSFQMPQQSDKSSISRLQASSIQGLKDRSMSLRHNDEDASFLASDRVNDDLHEFERQFGTSNTLQVASEFKTGVAKPMLTIKNFEKVSHDQYSQAILSSGRAPLNKPMGTVESPHDARLRHSSISGFVDRTSQLNEFSDKVTPANMISLSKTKTKAFNQMNLNVGSQNATAIKVGPFTAAHKNIFEGIKLHGMK